MPSELISNKLKDLPANSGVYIMLSKEGQILYIGKARSLKNRVRQYFMHSANKTEKVVALVRKIHDFNYIITNNEIEALVLENNLIKKHKPPYNILLKDDKNYPFIRINTREDFPRLEVVRKLKNDGAKYFGPYMQGISTKDLFDVVYSAFPVRQCKLKFDKIPAHHRPCLNYHIGRCLAPCVGYAGKEEYRAVIDDVINFLNGHDRKVQEILEGKMRVAAESEDYELAIHYRDKLKTLDKIVRKQVTAMPKDYNMDIFAVASNGFNTVVAILVVRGGKLLGGHKETVADVNADSVVLANYIISYYGGNKVLADEIVTSIEIDSAEVVEEYLGEISGKKINVVTPHMGVRRQLADMCANNASDYLEKSVSLKERKENLTMGGVVQLQEYLGLDRMPIRMECYDISNISGTDKVSSMVVFTNGEPDRSQYRRFKIKTVVGSNDFASMKETVMRRFNRYKEGKDSSFSTFPDLIIIDGGLGQLSYTKSALDEVGVADVNVISLAERDEYIYTLKNNVPIILDKNSYALRLLQRIRDEAHRFAITFHRKLREKRQTASVLLEIEGVGERTRDNLLAAFKTMSAIKKASADELKKVKGVSSKTAENIAAYFSDRGEE